ncbi:hypothetical protein NDU88_005295 [Pleurodeles waltl]|uniref:Secreted protein n=1 Tax=Pleurodeles waltl TaxID=8319 RepID=A0AAV7MA39_PLEWA|nr:hypothetical protein NDU88_005295 [Pleurodeles waltl]
MRTSIPAVAVHLPPYCCLGLHSGVCSLRQPESIKRRRPMPSRPVSSPSGVLPGCYSPSSQSKRAAVMLSKAQPQAWRMKISSPVNQAAIFTLSVSGLIRRARTTTSCHATTGTAGSHHCT